MQTGANEASIPEVSKPEGPGKSWRANNSYVQEMFRPTTGQSRRGHLAPLHRNRLAEIIMEEGGNDNF